MVEGTVVAGLLAWLVVDNCENDVPALVPFFLVPFTASITRQPIKKMRTQNTAIIPAVAVLTDDAGVELDPLLPWSLLSTITDIEDVVFKPFRFHVIAVSVTLPFATASVFQ